MKAKGVLAFEANAEGTVDTDEAPGSYYLLSHLEGFTVKNRLVGEDRIGEEF